MTIINLVKAGVHAAPHFAAPIGAAGAAAEIFTEYKQQGKAAFYSQLGGVIAQALSASILCYTIARTGLRANNAIVGYGAAALSAAVIAPQIAFCASALAATRDNDETKHNWADKLGRHVATPATYVHYLAQTIYASIALYSAYRLRNVPVKAGINAVCGLAPLATIGARWYFTPPATPNGGSGGGTGSTGDGTA